MTVDAGAILAVQPGGNSGWGNTQIAILLGSTHWSDSTAAFGIDTSSGNFTYGGNITLAVGLTKLGANTLTLTGSNTYSGVTAIDGGTLSLGSAAALGGGNITFGGGALQFTSSNTTDYSAQFANSTAAPISIDTNGQAVNFGSSIASSNTAGLVKTGSGMLTLAPATATPAARRSAAARWSPRTIPRWAADAVVLCPVLRHGNLGLHQRGAVDRLAGRQRRRFPWSCWATPRPTRPPCSPWAPNNASTTFSGAISDLVSTASAAVGSLTKAGSGTLTLSGVNTYSGTTTVAAGALSVAGTASLPGYSLPNNVGVAGGAVLAVQLGDGTTGWSSGQIASLLADVKWANSTAAFGIDTSSGNATFSGNLTIPSA